MENNYLKKYSILFILVGSLFTLLLLTLISYKLLETNNKNLKDRAIYESSLKINLTKDFYYQYGDFLNEIEKNRFFTSYLEESSLKNKEDLITLFKTLVLHDRNITQLRYINASGKEIVRVDRNKINDEIQLIKENKLQDKKHRDYFIKTMEKKKGELFVSNLNLNIENKEIEKPFKPVWRFAIPVFLDDNSKGIIIVNIFGEYLLNNLISSELFFITIYDQDKNLLVSNDFSKNIWTKYLKTKSNIKDSDFILSKELLSGLGDEVLYIGVKEKYSDNIFEIIGYDFIYLISIIIILAFILALYLSEIPKKLIYKLTIQNKALEKKDNTISKYVVLSKTDKYGVITEVTDAFCELTGFTKNELIGSSHKILRHPDTNKELIENIWKTIKNGKTWIGEIKNKTKTGEDYWVYANISPDYDYKGNHIGYLSIKYDITSNKKFLKQLKAEKDKATKANSAKSEFLANMSHEIRTPLNGIIGLTELCLQSSLNKTQKNYLEKALFSSKSLLNILNDILDYSKIEAGKIDINHEEFNLNTLLENVSNLFISKIYEKNLKFNYSIDSDVPLIVIGDALRITQILSNYLSNAIKFTEKGSIELNISLISKDKENILLSFKVKDTGIGVSEEKQNEIFNSFSQEDSSTTKEYGGTGLGLSISKNLVELMEGEVFFKSHKNIGSIFGFKLNLKEVSNSESNNNKSTFSNKLEIQNIKVVSEKNALIVEDNEINQLVISRILKNIGFKVDIVNNGKDAIEYFKENSYDIVFMDIQMPILNGFETTKEIRNIDKEIPIIALSAAVMQKDKTKSLEVGMNAHIEKPINTTKLKDLIKKYFKTINIEEVIDDSNIINLKNIDLKKIQNTLKIDDQEIYSMYDKFKNDYRNTQHIKELELNSKEFHEFIHKLKGVSGNLAIQKVYDISKEINETNNISKLDDLIKEINFVVKEIENKITPLINIESNNLNKEDLKNLIKKVSDAYDNYEFIKNREKEILLFNLKNKIDKQHLDELNILIENKQNEQIVEKLKVIQKEIYE